MASQNPGCLWGGMVNPFFISSWCFMNCWLGRIGNCKTNTKLPGPIKSWLTGYDYASDGFMTRHTTRDAGCRPGCVKAPDQNHIHKSKLIVWALLHGVRPREGLGQTRSLRRGWDGIWTDGAMTLHTSPCLITQYRCEILYHQSCKFLSDQLIPRFLPGKHYIVHRVWFSLQFPRVYTLFC